MRRILLVTSLFALMAAPFLATEALAYELPLGIIVVTDAGATSANQGLNSTSNLTTATPFRIDALVPITVQPSVAAYVCVETVANYDAGILLSDGGTASWTQYKAPSCRQADGGSFGVRVEANVAFPSSCGESRLLAMPDGGFSSCVVSCVPVSGTSVSCPVSRRQANHSPPEF